MNLINYLSDLSTKGWIALLFTITIWLSLCLWLGGWSEQKTGDREAGVLIGFFLPALVLLVYWWIK